MPNLVQSSGNGNAVGAYTGGANPWAEAARGVETGAYLKFNGNDGIYSFGQDDEELPVKSRVVGDMESLAFGFMCWVDSNVEEEVLVPVLEGVPPPEHKLTDYGPYNDDDGWREAASVSLVIESFGNDDQDEAVGTPLLWKTSTGGQVRQIRKLSGAYGRVVAQHPGEFPIIELDAESYVPKNKKHGKIKWSPKLKIVGWISAEELDGLTGGGAADDDDFEEPAQRQTSRREPEPEPEEEAPRRRRAAPVEDEVEEAPAPRRRAAAPVEDEQPEEEPAPRRRRAAPEPEVEEDETPAPRRRAAAPPADEGDEDEDTAPAPRGRRRPAPQAADEADEGEEDVAPAPRRRAAPAAEDDADEAPAPRRGAGRGAPPANARLRRFD